MSFLSYSRPALRASSFKQARRLVYNGCHSSPSLSSLFVTHRPSPSSIRLFSSSRPYATVLYEQHTPSTQPPPPESSASRSGGDGYETVLISPPKPEAVDPDDELVDGAEARFRISPRAAQQLRSIAQRDNDPNVALRVAVESGGCHGYQYKIELTSLDTGAGDYHFSNPTFAPSNVLIDPVSLSLLKGSTLDFATELIGSTFRVTDNPQAGGGCGCGVSWEPKL